MAKRNTTKSPDIAPAAAPSGIVRANINRNVVRSPNYVSIYTNDVQVQTTPWDIRLMLGEIQGIVTGDKPSVTVMQIADLRMSPQLTKKLTMILIQQLKTYEEQMGPIPLPPD